MRELMRQIADRLYTFQVNAGDPDFQAVMERWAPDAWGWDVPKLDKGFMEAIEACRAAAEGNSNKPWS